MQFFFLLSVLFLVALCEVEANYPDCSQFVTCKTCIATKLCGWCETSIVYNDSTTGPQCAGRPPGGREWVCPSSFQNSYCPAYLCSKQNYQCQPTNKTDGLPFKDCFAACLAPVYACNQTDAKCYEAPPGMGVSLPDCKKICAGGTYKCNKKNFQCEKDPNGVSFEQCQQGCFPPIYNCSETNKTCYIVPPGTLGGSDLQSCQKRCAKISQSPSAPSAPSVPTAPQQQYVCDQATLTCKNSTTGQSFAECNSTCGNPSNVTPVGLIGDYRGIQVNKGFVKGEWTMQITAAIVVIKDPSNKVWAKGNIGSYKGELWLQTSEGKYRGIYTEQQLPEVKTLVWALGALNGPVPVDFDAAVVSGKVFSMKKCLNPKNCQWILSHSNEEKVNVMKGQGVRVRHITKHAENDQLTNDPCEPNPDCFTCLSDPRCGWCSIPAFYTVGNQTCSQPGKNCVSFNSTYCCGPGEGVTFSTVTCPANTPPTTQKPTTSPPTSIPPLMPTGPIAPVAPTQKPILYDCNPNNQTCQESTGPSGMPKDQCELVCNAIPDVPVILRGRKFRGLQIQKGYIVGEWVIAFTTSNATITTPGGQSITVIVSQTGPYMVFNAPDGKKTYVLWQITQDAVTDFLSLAYGANGQPPASYDSSMTTTGEQAYVFDGCSQLSQKCFFP